MRILPPFQTIEKKDRKSYDKVDLTPLPITATLRAIDGTKAHKTLILFCASWTCSLLTRKWLTL